jgi:uncharacterized protein (DUF1778 family)
MDETKRGRGRPPGEPTTTITFRLPAADRPLIEQAAEIEEVSTNKWIVQVLTKAARRVIRRAEREGGA